MENTPKGLDKLQQSEERYQKMIAEVKDYAILMLDTEGNILNWNLGAQHIKGYNAEDAIGRNFRIFYMDSDRENLLPETLINEARTNGRAMHEGWRVRKDGSMFWGSVVITALHGDDDSVIGFSKVTRDLTERKLAEDRIKSYTKDIEFRNKQLEEFAYIASHDLQEPLRKIQIFAEMLENSLDDKEAAERYAEKIASSAERMSNLIKSVLKYSQLSRTDDNLNETVNLNDVLNNVKEDYDLLLREKEAEIIAKDLPVVRAMPVQMHQLFANLISNSIKFSTTTPKITITAEPLEDSQKSNYGESLKKELSYTKIIVADNGIGFEQQYADQVFKIFKRLTDSTGTGIGLALCKKIIDNHNGHISVASTLGKGTRFTILLPVQD